MSPSYKQKYFDLLERHNALLEQMCAGEVAGEVDVPESRQSGCVAYPLGRGYWVVTMSGEVGDWSE